MGNCGRACTNKTVHNSNKKNKHKRVRSSTIFEGSKIEQKSQMVIKNKYHSRQTSKTSEQTQTDYDEKEQIFEYKKINDLDFSPQTVIKPASDQNNENIDSNIP